MAGDGSMLDDRGGLEPASFEKEIENLQRVVDLLERGELDLEEAIRQYESGFQSLKKCYQVLDNARKRIEILGVSPPQSPRGDGVSPPQSPRGDGVSPPQSPRGDEEVPDVGERSAGCAVKSPESTPLGPPEGKG
jgi:exodeoxyribonuclease VII small subunit